MLLVRCLALAGVTGLALAAPVRQQPQQPPPPQHRGAAAASAETQPSEFLVKFQSGVRKHGARRAQGTLNAGAAAKAGGAEPTPADQLRAWHRASGVGAKDAGGVPTSGEEDELSYRIMQTIKGSYAAIGPLSCESVCHVKRGRPVCKTETFDCQLGCAERCEAGTNEVELKEKLCVEGCTLFCGVHPTQGAGGFAPKERGISEA